MIKDTQTCVIKGHKYEIFHLPVMGNISLFNEFMATVGDSFTSFLSSIGSLVSPEATRSSLNDIDINLGEIGDGMNKLFKSLHKHDPSGELILKILSQTTRDGVAINKNTIDGFFKGNIKELMVSKIYFLPFLPIESLFGSQSTTGKVIQENTES
jgi:hypothetical protein